jgi:hypothetical protein
MAKKKIAALLIAAAVAAGGRLGASGKGKRSRK